MGACQHGFTHGSSFLSLIREENSGSCLYGIDRELRTDDLTVVTVHTIRRSGDNRGMITFFIEPGGKDEDVFWAVFDAVPATLAAVFQDVDDTFSHFNFRCVKRDTPVIHSFLPQLIGPPEAVKAE
jgi:hypothetical protein